MSHEVVVGAAGERASAGEDVGSAEDVSAGEDGRSADAVPAGEGVGSAGGNGPEDRGPAPSGTAGTPAGQSPLAGGPPRFPRRYVYFAAYGALALLVVLALGAFLVNRYASTPTGASTPSGSVRLPSTGAPSGTVPPASTHELGASLAEFMDLDPLHGRAAKDFTLRDATTGAAVSLSSLSGHVVVLTFADAACDDICPVLATELHRAAALLGATKAPITFVTVNTDPLDTKTGDVAIVAQPKLSSLSDWRFLTGTVRQLNPVWKAYGVAIRVDETSGEVSHDDPVYFISPTGKLWWSATAFGDESARGRFTLPAKDKARYARGVAHYADRLGGRT